MRPGSFNDLEIAKSRVSTLSNDPGNEAKLRLYGLFKQVSCTLLCYYLAANKNGLLNVFFGFICGYRLDEVNITAKDVVRGGIRYANVKRSLIKTSRGLMFYM